MSQKMHAFVLVGFEPDWEALYINGDKVAEGHHVEKQEIFKAGTQCEHFEDVYAETLELKTTHVESDEGDEHEEHVIPDRLEDLPAGAFERIS